MAFMPIPPRPLPPPRRIVCRKLTPDELERFRDEIDRLHSGAACGEQFVYGMSCRPFVMLTAGILFAVCFVIGYWIF